MRSPAVGVRCTPVHLATIDRIARELGVTRAEIMRCATDPALARRVSEIAQRVDVDDVGQEVGRG